MPSKAGLKRTIKLRQPNAAGSQFIKVKNKAFSYPIFDWFSNWFSLYQGYQEEQASQAAAWRPFTSLGFPNLSNSQIQWLVQNPLAPDPGAAGFEGWSYEINQMVDEPVFTVFADFIFEQATFGLFPETPQTHFVGTVNEDGNIDYFNP